MNSLFLSFPLSKYALYVGASYGLFLFILMFQIETSRRHVRRLHQRLRVWLQREV